jgi:meiotically up-regulated gene 157 (Mug157) protein
MAVSWQVDGLGGSLKDFDDPNVPSLLSIPLLGYAQYNKGIYEATRQRILSSANQWHFKGSALQGLGSPHTPRTYVWPLAMTVQVGHTSHTRLTAH